MRVVHIITRLILGGAQENTLHNVEDLQQMHGDDVLLVTGPAEGPEGDLFERAKRHRVRIELLPDLKRAIDPLADWRVYRQLKRLIRKVKPDVVHTHSSKAGILGRAAAWDCRVPAVVHTIHGLPFHPFESRFKNALYVYAERFAAKRCHRIICVADAMTRQALAAHVGNPEQYITIYSGMDVEPFLHPAVDRETVRTNLGVAPGDVAVMKVARLFELKGHDDIIDAAEELLKRNPSLRFIFVGGGLWRDRLEARVREIGQEGRFIFTGLVSPERIPELLGASDIVVHTSYREGLARVLPQAMIASRPVVSYDVDGAPEVVIPGKTGFLVRPSDIEGLSKAIETLAEDPALRQQMGEAGREWCTDRFRHETMTAQIRKVYEEILAKRQDP